MYNAVAKSNTGTINCRSRVFLLGPSHHVYTQHCLLSTATSFSTPFG